MISKERHQTVTGPACFQRNGAVMICTQSVEQFSKTYVSLGRIAKKLKCRQGVLAIKLKTVDVPMLAMPPKFSPIYRQIDFEHMHD